MLYIKQAAGLQASACRPPAFCDNTITYVQRTPLLHSYKPCISPHWLPTCSASWMARCLASTLGSCRTKQWQLSFSQFIPNMQNAAGGKVRGMACHHPNTPGQEHSTKACNHTKASHLEPDGHGS